MPNGDGWKETFKFFVKELEEVYLPQLKDIWDLIFPVPPLGGEPEETPREVPQPVPAPPPTAPYTPSVPYNPPMHMVAGEPPTGPPAYDSPTVEPTGTPFPPWDPDLPDGSAYGYEWRTPTPFEIAPYPTPWWQGPGGIPGVPDVPWWRQIPPELYEFDTHIVRASFTDSERKA